MYFVYSLALTLAFLALSPRFLFDALRHGKYVAGFRERLGSLLPLDAAERPVIWLHCVSVGETQAARPLVKSILERFPNHLLVISTITATGQDLARDVFSGEVARVFYFPFDWRWTVRRALNAIQPAAVLLMETELWPGFLRECHVRKIPVAIVNGRVSASSFRRYKLVKGFISRALKSIELAIMQTDTDAERLCGLGINPERVFVSGNMKFDAGLTPVAESTTEELRRRFNPNGSPLILAASTHAPEERIVLEAFMKIKAESDSNPRLFIVPRHPERFAEVAALIGETGLEWVRRSANPSAKDTKSEVVLLDTIGELQAAYALSSIVFVGGSIPKCGGHNILEPAAAELSIVTGPHTENFKQIVEQFARAGAIIQLSATSQQEVTVELSTIFNQLLGDMELRKELGRKAKQLLQQNVGATRKTLQLITPMIESPSFADDQNSSAAGQEAHSS